MPWGRFFDLLAGSAAPDEGKGTESEHSHAGRFGDDRDSVRVEEVDRVGAVEYRGVDADVSVAVGGAGAEGADDVPGAAELSPEAGAAVAGGGGAFQVEGGGTAAETAQGVRIASGAIEVGEQGSGEATAVRKGVNDVECTEAIVGTSEAGVAAETGALVTVADHGSGGTEGVLEADLGEVEAAERSVQGDDGPVVAGVAAAGCPAGVDGDAGNVAGDRGGVVSGAEADG